MEKTTINILRLLVKEMNEGCKAFVIIAGLICISISFCSLVFGYFPGVSYNKDFTSANCYLAPGVVFPGNCEVHRHGCWNCYESCWTAYYGLTAAQGKVVYFFLATFFDEQSANNAINYQIGAFYSPCYYKDGGSQIVFYLSDTEGTLIASIVFAVLAVVVILPALIYAFCMYCKISKECHHVKHDENHVKYYENPHVPHDEYASYQHSINAVSDDIK